MATEQHNGGNPMRLIVLAVVTVIIVAGLTLVIMAVSQAGAPAVTGEINYLADSDDDCVTCHERNTPGIVEQYGHSTMAAAEVTCRL